MANVSSALALALIVSANTNNARAEMGSFGHFIVGKMKQMRDAGAKMQVTGKNMRQSGLDDVKQGLAAIAPVAFAAKKAMSFEDARADWAKVANVDRSSVEFKKMNGEALKLGRYLAKDGEEAYSLFSSLTASGIKDSDLKYVSKIAGEASVAFDMIADEAGTVYTGIKKAIGLQNFNSKIVQLKALKELSYKLSS